MNKTYNITEVREQGTIYNRIRLYKENKQVFQIKWLPSDKEQEKISIRSADLTIIRLNLNYETRTLKPIK